MLLEWRYGKRRCLETPAITVATSTWLAMDIFDLDWVDVVPIKDGEFPMLAMLVYTGVYSIHGILLVCYWVEKKGLKLGANSWVPCHMIQELFGIGIFFPQRKRGIWWGHSLDPKKSVGFQWRKHDDLGKLSSLKRDPFALMKLNLRHPNFYFIVMLWGISVRNSTWISKAVEASTSSKKRKEAGTWVMRSFCDPRACIKD